jgi:hypothetical protein
VVQEKQRTRTVCELDAVELEGVTLVRSRVESHTPTSTRGSVMNETFRELKGRVRRLDEVLQREGLQSLEFAQAVSRVQRVVRKSDRSREPTAELQALLERAELLGRARR